jgi:hypothetical protein
MPPAFGNIVWSVCINLDVFCLKTLQTVVGMSAYVCPGSNVSWISGHSALHVNVMKNVGGPSAAAIISESAIWFDDHRQEPKLREQLNDSFECVVRYTPRKDAGK